MARNLIAAKLFFNGIWTKSEKSLERNDPLDADP